MIMTLYSTGCPKCKILKNKLDRAGFVYTEEASVDKMLALGITQVPVLEADGKLLSFKQANDVLNEIIKDRE